MPRPSSRHSRVGVEPLHRVERHVPVVPPQCRSWPSPDARRCRSRRAGGRPRRRRALRRAADTAPAAGRSRCSALPAVLNSTASMTSTPERYCGGSGARVPSPWSVRMMKCSPARAAASGDFVRRSGTVGPVGVDVKRADGRQGSAPQNAAARSGAAGSGSSRKKKSGGQNGRRHRSQYGALSLPRAQVGWLRPAALRARSTGPRPCEARRRGPSSPR